MRHRPWTRTVRISLAACAAVATCVAANPQGHATPEPDIHTAQQRVDELYHKAEQAAERFNDLRHQLGVARQQLSAVEADVAAQQEIVGELGDEVGDLVAAQAQATPGGTTGQLLSSGDADAFLSGLAAMQAYNVTQTDLLDSVEAQQAELALRVEQVEEQVAVIERAKRQMADEQAQVQANFDEATALLDELEAAQRAAVIAAQQSDLPQEVPGTGDDDADGSGDGTEGDGTEGDGTERGGTEGGGTEGDGTEDGGTEDGSAEGGSDGGAGDVEVQASASAQAAVDFALAQLGDAYVYGAMGPDAWDCSGLTMGSWAAAGVSLPHSSSAQSGMGVAVSFEDLQPGDLVFYYSPISHVGIYIGNGQLVHAPNPSSAVEIVGVSDMPIAAIRRVG